MTGKPTYEELEQRIQELEKADAKGHQETSLPLYLREKLSASFKETSVAMAIVSLDGHFINTNPALQEMLGYCPSELAEKTFQEIVHPADIGADLFPTRELFSNKKSAFRTEKRFVRKDGQIVWGRLSGSFVRDTTDQPSFFISMVEDISDQKYAEQALKESERRYRLVSENTLDIIWTMDLDLVFTFVNPAIYKIAGYKPEEWIGTHLSEHCDEENFEKMARLAVEELAKGPGGGSDLIFEATMFKKHRVPTTVEIHCKVIYDDSGQPTGLHGTTRDISDRLERENAHKQLQAQLIQAQKMESVGRLAGGVAHDFNNMLSVIMGYAEVALSKVNPKDSLYSDLNEILEITHRSTEITRQLLAFARQQNIAPKVIDLNEAIDSMQNILRRLVGKDIQINWLPGTGVWPVKMDPAQVDQVMANLCVNSRDAITDFGEITIETGNTNLDEAYCAEHAGFRPGEYVCLSISDNGSGMNTETLDKVFEPFFTTKEIGKGTGLGLATVYGIVKQNKGFINVYSEPDFGTIVKIYLPRQMALPQAESKRPIQEIPSGKGETVLLVDDDNSILDIIRDLLETLGYRVLACPSATEAISLAKNRTDAIDLLITDVVMPKINGQDLAVKLQGIFPGIKILFMSGYTASVIANRGVLKEGLRFIQKPFSKEHLAVKVREALE